MAADTTVITAARMIDVLNGREVDKPQVVITGDRITAVGKQGDPVPADARKIDLGARTLLPGLIDMHVHLTSDPIYSGYRRLGFTDSFWMTVGVANARKTLESGFTTVRTSGRLNMQMWALNRGSNAAISSVHASFRHLCDRLDGRSLRCDSVSPFHHYAKYPDRQFSRRVPGSRA
jgi:imidazolonepropionase-like amidohydrolase